MTKFNFSGIEDQMNWHGKALGKESANALKAIKDNMSNQGPHGLKPAAIVDDAPAVSIKNVALSEPPNYKKGQTVSLLVTFLTFTIVFVLCVCLILTKGYVH